MVLLKLGTPAPSLALEAAKVAAIPTLLRLTHCTLAHAFSDNVLKNVIAIISVLSKFIKRSVPMEISGKPDSIPRKMIVTLQVGGVFFAIANIICVAILAYTYMKVKYEPRRLEVKGSAKKAIVSDTITWQGAITARLSLIHI